MFTAQAKQAALADVIGEFRLREAQLEAAAMGEKDRADKAEARVNELEAEKAEPESPAQTSPSPASRS